MEPMSSRKKIPREAEVRGGGSKRRGRRTKDNGPDHDGEHARDAKEVQVEEGEEESDADAEAEDVSPEVVHVREEIADPRLGLIATIAHRAEPARGGAVAATIAGVHASIQIYEGGREGGREARKDGWESKEGDTHSLVFTLYMHRPFAT
jgi:hypothetical protein